MPSQLQINQGPQDALLYDNSRSYFTNQGYSRTSNFQVELKDLNSTSQAGWGQSIRFPITKSGDLLGPCDLLMNFTHTELEAAMGSTYVTNDCSVAWVEALGFAMIRRVKFEVGTMTVEEISGDQMYIQNELMKDQHHRLGVHTIAKTGRPAQRGTVSGGTFTPVRPTDLTVNNGSRLICSTTGSTVTSYDSKQLIIPLGMFFMKGPGSYFPLCAIAGCHEVTITVELRNLNELLVIKSAPTVSGTSITTSTKAKAGPAITNTSIKIDKCVMRCHYVHVTGPEATLTMNKEHVRLMKLWTPPREVFFEVKTSASDVKKVKTVSKLSVELPFLHPISELIFIIRRQKEMGTSTDPAMKPEDHDQGSQSKNRFALHGGGNKREPNLDHGARCYADQSEHYASTTIDLKSINVRLNGSSRHPDLQAVSTDSGQAIDRHYLQHRLMPMLHSNTGTLMQDVFAGHTDTSGIDLSAYTMIPADTTAAEIAAGADSSSAAIAVANGPTSSVNDFNKYNFEALSEMVDRKEIYVFPFSLSPESQQPSGAVNFSKVSQAYLEIDMESYSNKAGEDKFQIDVWGVHYNWMMCKDGKCQLSFA